MTIEKKKEIQEVCETIENLVSPVNPLFMKDSLEESKKRLKWFNGKFERFDNKEKCLIVKDEEGVHKLYLCTQTFVYKDFGLKGGTMISVIEYPLKDPKECVAVSILPAEDGKIFMQDEDIVESAKDIRNFTRFSPAQRDLIKRERSGPQYPAYDAGQDMVFKPEEWETKYKLTKTAYPTQAQAAIEALFKESKKTRCGKAKDKLQNVFGVSPARPEHIELDFEEVSKELNRRLPHKEKEIKVFTDFLEANKRAGKSGFKILLVGPPGTGKSQIIIEFADIAKIPMVTIHMAGKVPLDLVGSDSSYEHSQSGAIKDAFKQWGNNDGILDFEELNCAEKSREGDPKDILLKLFDGIFIDAFDEVPVDCSNLKIVATCNDIDSISPALLNRFDAVIRTEEYTVEEKVDIAVKRLIPDLLKNYGLNENDILFPDETLRHIIRYCSDFGVRDMQHRLNALIAAYIGEKCGTGFKVDIPFVDRILSAVVDTNNPGIKFNRNREFYSEDVAEAFKKLAPLYSNKAAAEAAGLTLGTVSKQVDHLLACKNEPPKKLEDPEAFRKILGEKHYGLDNVLDEITAYCCMNEHCRDAALNFCLAGGKGVGKSTICLATAKAMGKPIFRFNLSAMKDPKELFGTNPSYKDAEPGIVAKIAKKADSMDYVLQVDEADKAGHEMQMALLTLLDRNIYESYLGCELDLRQVTIILCVNDWGALDPLVRDRVTKIEVAGYSKAAKRSILEDYLIPKLEGTYSAKDSLTIHMDEDAKDLLLEDYSASFGVRDLEKNLQRILGRKLYENYIGFDGNVHITKEDVARILGRTTVLTGNFPYDENRPGIAKMLGVLGGSIGTVNAVETVLVPTAGDRKEEMHITGLPQETMRESCQVAFYYMRIHYPELFNGKDVYLHFSEASVKKDGPSAGITVACALYSAAIRKPIMVERVGDIAFTGEIDLVGQCCPVGGVEEKLQAGNASGCKKVFVPKENYLRLEKKFLDELDCEVIPVESITEVISQIFVE